MYYEEQMEVLLKELRKLGTTRTARKRFNEILTDCEFLLGYIIADRQSLVSLLALRQDSIDDLHSLLDSAVNDRGMRVTGGERIS